MDKEFYNFNTDIKEGEKGERIIINFLENHGFKLINDNKDNKYDVKILTSCPSCLQCLSRYGDETGTDADYIVVEIAKNNLGANWLQDYVEKANNGGIEKVLL